MRRTERDILEFIFLMFILYCICFLIPTEPAEADTLGLSGTVPVKIAGAVNGKFYTNAGNEIKINTKKIGQTYLVTVKAL